MNSYKQCVICGITLPISYLTPIQVKHQGKIVVVPICNSCKQKKEEEAKNK
jgi:hypothetical protein